MANKKYSYNSSKTNTNKDMPLFLTKFFVTFVLPPALQQKYGTDILTEQVVSIGGLELDKFPEIVEQKYKGISRRFGGTVADTNVDLEFVFNVNVTKEGRIYPLNVIRDWSRLIYNNTGLVVTKEDYSGSVIIEVHNVKNEILRKVKVPVFFPKDPMPAMDLNYNEEAQYELTMGFVAENASDVYVD